MFLLEDNLTKYTSFTTLTGQFKFLKMPFGLNSSPATFARFINKIFEHLCDEEIILIYFDDILIATETIQENLDTLNEASNLMTKNLLELRLDKCSILKNAIEFLGYLIHEKGIGPNPSNVSAILHYPVPCNTKDVQKFIGLARYFRKFVKNFSIIAKPLYDLLKKIAKFSFNQEHLLSFESLKEKLTSQPILAIYSQLVTLNCIVM